MDLKAVLRLAVQSANVISFLSGMREARSRHPMGSRERRMLQAFMMDMNNWRNWGVA